MCLGTSRLTVAKKRVLHERNNPGVLDMVGGRTKHVLGAMASREPILILRFYVCALRTMVVGCYCFPFVETLRPIHFRISHVEARFACDWHHRVRPSMRGVASSGAGVETR